MLLHLLKAVSISLIVAIQALALEAGENDLLLEEIPLDDERPIFLLLNEEGFHPISIPLPKEDLKKANSQVLNAAVGEAGQQKTSAIEVPITVESIESFKLILKFLKNQGLKIDSPETLAHLISYAFKFDIKPLANHLKKVFDHPHPDQNFKHFDVQGLYLIAERLREANSGPKREEISLEHWGEYLNLRFGEYMLRRGLIENPQLYKDFRKRFKNNRAMKAAISPSLEGLNLARREIKWQKGPIAQEMKDEKPSWLVDAETHAKRSRKKPSLDQQRKARKISRALLNDVIMPKLVDQTFLGKKQKFYVAVDASLAWAIAHELRTLSEQSGARLRVQIDPDLAPYDVKSPMLNEGSGIIKNLKCDKWQTNSFGSTLAHCTYCTSQTVGCILCPAQCLTCGWCFCGCQRTNGMYDCLNNCLDSRTGDFLFYCIHESCTFVHSGCKGPERTLMIETQGW